MQLNIPWLRISSLLGNPVKYIHPIITSFSHLINDFPQQADKYSICIFVRKIPVLLQCFSFTLILLPHPQDFRQLIFCDTSWASYNLTLF